MIAEKLRKAVLQAAIQGKLTQQLPEDGDARDLLKQIQQEKAQLIKVGKLRKEKTLPIITEDDVPFDIPENWVWLRLGDIAHAINGDRGKNYPGKDYWTSTGVPFINAGCLVGKYLSRNTFNYITRERYELLRSGFIEISDLLYCLRGSLGKLSINRDYKEGAIASSLVIIRFFNKEVVEYVYNVLFSDYGSFLIQKASTGTAQPNLSAKNVVDYLIPFPPLNEQYRINSQINALYQQTEALQDDEKTLYKLQSNFPVHLKNAILQHAMEGKLTDQRPEDGNASDLLEKIRIEKAQLIKEGKLRKHKPLPAIAEEEVPFDIPENWCWVRLEEVSFDRGQKKPDKDFTYIDISSIDNKQHKLGTLKNVLDPKQAPSRARKMVKKGDVIYSTVRPYLKNICVIEDEISPEPIVSTGFAVVSTPYPTMNRFLFYCFLSPMFDSYANSSENAKGVAYPAINDSKFRSAPIPCPPLSEQERIVQRLEALLPLCETLE